METRCCSVPYRKYECFRSDGTWFSRTATVILPVCPAVCGRLLHAWGKLTHSAYFPFRYKWTAKKKNHQKTHKSTSWHSRKRKGHCIICLNIVYGVRDILFSSYAIVGTRLKLVLVDGAPIDKIAFTEKLMNERIKNPGIYIKISD